MMKPKFNNRHRPNDRQYRIGISDLSIDSLWNPDADKYKAFCRMMHVTKAARYIGYVQWAISTVIFSFFLYHYAVLSVGNVPTDHWIHQYTLKYLAQLLFAITLQMLIVGVLLHGIKTENKSYLLPYIIYASIAILAGFAQLSADFMNMDNNYVTGVDINTSSGAFEIRKIHTTRTQFFSHLIGTLIHAWCLSVVWRCYGYFGDKKIAFRIGEQLRDTQAAFQYPDQLLAGGYYPMPPPYADTVLPPSAAAYANQTIVYALNGEKSARPTPADAPIVVDVTPLISSQSANEKNDH